MTLNRGKRRRQSLHQLGRSGRGPQVPPITASVSVAPGATGTPGKIITVTFSDQCVISGPLPVTTTAGTLGPQTILSTTQVTMQASVEQEGATISMPSAPSTARGFSGAQITGFSTLIVAAVCQLKTVTHLRQLTFSIEAQSAGGVETTIVDTSQSGSNPNFDTTGPALVINAVSWIGLTSGDTVTCGGPCSLLTDIQGFPLVLAPATITVS